MRFASSWATDDRFAGAAGPQYLLAPHEVFLEAREVWLPVPEGVQPEALRLYEGLADLQ